MKVYSPDQNYRLSKIVLAAKIYKKQLGVESVGFEPKVSKTFKEAYPQYSLPLLETESGRFITGTNSILLYLTGEENLKNAVQKAHVLEQLQKVERQIELPTGILVLHSKGFNELSEAQLQKSKQVLIKYFKQQNQKLSLRTFLAGDRLTVADISSYHNICAVKKEFEKDLEKLKNLQRWMNHLQSLDKQ